MLSIKSAFPAFGRRRTALRWIPVSFDIIAARFVSLNSSECVSVCPSCEWPTCGRVHRMRFLSSNLSVCLASDQRIPKVLFEMKLASRLFPSNESTLRTFALFARVDHATALQIKWNEEFNFLPVSHYTIFLSFAQPFSTVRCRTRK